MCHLREHLARIFFSSPLYVHEFFLARWSCARIFSYTYALAGYFFSKSPPPPPPQKLNGRPLIVVNNTICLHFILLNFTYFCLNIAEKALCVYDMFCGIQEILLLLNKNNTQNDSSRPWHSLHVRWHLKNVCSSRKTKNEWCKKEQQIIN